MNYSSNEYERSLVFSLELKSARCIRRRVLDGNSPSESEIKAEVDLPFDVA